MAEIYGNLQSGLGESLLRMRLVSRVENLGEDLIFEIGDENQKYNVYAMLLVDSVVFHVDLKLPIASNFDAAYKFLNFANQQIPFGSFYVSGNDNIAFKMFLLSASLTDDEDLSFSIYWMFDILSTYKTALGVAVSPIENAYQMAEQLLQGIRETLRSSPDSDFAKTE